MASYRWLLWAPGMLPCLLGMTRSIGKSIEVTVFFRAAKAADVFFFLFFFLSHFSHVCVLNVFDLMTLRRNDAPSAVGFSIGGDIPFETICCRLSSPQTSSRNCSWVNIRHRMRPNCALYYSVWILVSVFIWSVVFFFIVLNAQKPLENKCECTVWGSWIAHST